MTRSDRAWRVGLSALLVLHAVVGWVARAPAMLTRQDDARYLVLARALRQGTYRDLMWPGTPLHHMYPPGYPALLALWSAVGGEQLDWLVALHIALSVATLAFAAVALRRCFSTVIALAMVAILAVNPFVVNTAGQIGSEGALALCLAIAVWADACLVRSRTQTVVVIAMAVAAPFMRTAGVILPVAVFAHWLLAKRFRDAAAMVVVGLVCVAPLLVWTFLDPTQGAGNSYAQDLVVTTVRHDSFPMVLGRRIVANSQYYVTRGWPYLVATPTIQGTVIDNVLSLLVLGVATVVGVAVSARRFRFGLLVLVATLGLLLVWPYWQVRYWIPLLPLLVGVLLAGAAALAGRLNARAATIAVAGIALVLMTSGAARTADERIHVAGCERGRAMPPDACLTADQASFFAAARFVRDSLPATARVLSAKSEPLHVYTGRPTAPLGPLVSLDSVGFWHAVHAQDVQYILLGALQGYEQPRLAPRLAEHCGSLRLVAAFPPRTYLFALPEAGVPARRNAADGCAAVASYRAERITFPTDP